LPAASFRFHLAMDTLAVRLTVPPIRPVRDFHPLVNAPCRAHNRKPESSLWLDSLIYVYEVSCRARGEHLLF